MNRTTTGAHGASVGGSPSTSAEHAFSGTPSASRDTRYRPRRRRTAAEPLAASWRPRPRGDGERRSRTAAARAGGIIRLVSAYGWRIYAVPVLVVLTVLVAFDASKPGGGALAGASTKVGVLGEPNGPVVTEAPSGPINLNIPTAGLPAGGPYTQAGAGTWHIVAGNGPRVGTGSRLYTYTVEIEDGIDVSEYGGDDAFAKLVDTTLDDPRSWIGQGSISLQRVDGSTQNPSFRISLTTPNTDHRPDLCGFQISYEASCYNRSAGRVVINLARWVRGALAFDGDLLTYRQYAINHEVGHAFGNTHVGCDTDGGLAPVMMQQSFGVADNYVAQLNKVDPYNSKAVPADGKTCKPNAWPVPGGKPSG